MKNERKAPDAQQSRQMHQEDVERRDNELQLDKKDDNDPNSGSSKFAVGSAEKVDKTGDKKDEEAQEQPLKDDLQQEEAKNQKRGGKKDISG